MTNAAMWTNKSCVGLVLMALLAAVLSSCSLLENSTVNQEGEESGASLGLADTYDAVRAGVRLILVYDPTSNSFVGSVENTTDQVLENVRVEVHLSTGIELGPTNPVDLAPGDERLIGITAGTAEFDTWTAHPEVGHGEHSGAQESEGNTMKVVGGSSASQLSKEDRLI